MAAVAARDHQFVGLDVLHQPQFFQIGDDPLAGLEPVQTAIGFGAVVVDFGVGGEDVEQRQLVALPHRVVIEIVGRSDLDAAGAEAGVHVLVGDDRDVSTGQRQRHVQADQVLVAFVAGMDRHGGIAQHGFRAGGGDDQITAALGQRVADVPHEAVFFVADHLQVRHGGVQHRVPVDQPLAAINQAFLVQADEHFPHRRRQSVVHGEAFARPVHRRAHPPQLAGDGAARFRLPRPHPLDERLAAQIVTGFVLAGQLPFHHHLGSDAGVIGARLPQGVVTLHPVVAGQRVHDGVLEGVAHVQGAGDVRRWNHDAVGRALAAGREIAPLLPKGVPALFDGLRFVSLVHGVLRMIREATSAAVYTGREV